MLTTDLPLSKDNFLLSLLTTAFIFFATRKINSISSLGTPWSPNRLLPCILTIESSLKKKTSAAGQRSYSKHGKICPFVASPDYIKGTS